MAKIDAFFKLMFDQGASDLHLTSGQQPILRLHGDMERFKYKVLEDGELKTMLYEIAPEVKLKQFSYLTSTSPVSSNSLILTSGAMSDTSVLNSPSCTTLCV